MFQILVRCERSAEFGSRCSEPNFSGFWTAYDVTEAPPASFWKDYERLGWTTRDGKHYCPQHNPDLIGEQVTISRDYVEVAPGVRVRWPGAHQPGDNMHIEVQHTIPSDVQKAVEDLVQQREEEPGPGRYDGAEQSHIDTLIDFLWSRDLICEARIGRLRGSLTGDLTGPNPYKEG